MRDREILQRGGFMEKPWSEIMRWLAAAVGAVVGLFMQMPAAVRLLMLLMVLDYFSGVGAAALGRSKKSDTGALSSKVGFIGLARKAMILGIVLLAAVLDRVMGSAACTGAVTLFYIVNESLSILENAVLLRCADPGKTQADAGYSEKRKRNGSGRKSENLKHTA